MEHTYKMVPKDYRMPKGFDVNVDEEYKQALKDYPTFKSIGVGAIIYSDNLKPHLKDSIEEEKTGKWYYWQAQKALSYIDTMIRLYSNSEYNWKKEDAGEYIIAKNRIEKDLKQYKYDIAKAKVQYELIKLEIFMRSKT